MILPLKGSYLVVGKTLCLKPKQQGNAWAEWCICVCVGGGWTSSVEVGHFTKNQLAKIILPNDQCAERPIH